MGTKQSEGYDCSPAKAVLLGALAPGVNVPTWNTLKIAFLMLGLCLVAMLTLAFTSSDLALTLHVVILVLITGSLFVLLSRFLAQTGFVDIEDQMQDLGLATKSSEEENKKTS